MLEQCPPDRVRGPHVALDQDLIFRADIRDCPNCLIRTRTIQYVECRSGNSNRTPSSEEFSQGKERRDDANNRAGNCDRWRPVQPVFFQCTRSNPIIGRDTLKELAGTVQNSASLQALLDPQPFAARQEPDVARSTRNSLQLSRSQAETVAERHQRRYAHRHGNIGNTTLTSAKFEPDRWSRRLAKALVGLSEASECFQDSLDERAAHCRGTEFSSGTAETVQRYGDALLALYNGACFGKEAEQDERFVRLRSALRYALDILAEHPALAHVADSSCSARKFVTVLADKAEETDLLHMLVGLMTRGRELQEDGFRVGCHELKELLGPNNADDTTELNTGLHVVLFHGLRFEKEVTITEDMCIVPFEQVRNYVDESLLRHFTPSLTVPAPWEPVGAIVKSFDWDPAFHPADANIFLPSDWGGSFRPDAEKLVELLAVTHAAPVACLVTMYYCVDPVACRLLGLPHRRAFYTFGRSAQSFDRFSVSRNACATALDEARVLFRERNDARFGRYEPIVARLAEAAARSGCFAFDDRILDVAIALERMYELDHGEIVFKLKTRAACFLESDTASRTQVFRHVGRFYDARSAIIHNARKKQWSERDREEAFGKGFDIARRSLGKLLREGPPTDWNEIVIAAAGDPRHAPAI